MLAGMAAMNTDMFIAKIIDFLRPKAHKPCRGFVTPVRHF